MSLTRVTIVASLLALAVGCARPQPPDYSPDVREVSLLTKAIGGGAAASEGAAKEVADPTGWATLKGRFRLSDPVSLPPIEVTKDPNICGTTAPNQAVVLGDDNALQYVVVYLSTKLPSLEDPWVHPDYAKVAENTVKFDQDKCIFKTHVLGMWSANKLQVLNSDKVGHNTNIPGFNYNKSVDVSGSDMIDGVKALSEPSPVSCSIHPWMSAFIMATPHPYIAVTNEQGEFEIKNVPAGVDLEFRVWQEKVKYVGGGSVGGTNQNWPKGRMKMKLENDEVRELDVVLDAGKFQ